ncbi:MAG: TatD family hydrolase [Fimbriimonadaceae bacterium]
MIDTHCHLNDAKAFPNPGLAVREAHDAGVEKLIIVGIDTEWSEIAIEIAEAHENVFAVVGWHPTSAAKYSTAELKKIEALAQHEKCVGIGEIGFDFHWDYSSLEQQTVCLLDQLELAESIGKPVVFHCREAYSALLDVLENRSVMPYLMHCFAGNLDDAQRCFELNCVFGVDGPVTYKKADDLRSALEFIGLDRLVLETDAPWLSPVPYRGKPNHPKYLGHICEGLAGVFGVEKGVVGEKTTRNAEKFFGI